MTSKLLIALLMLALAFVTAQCRQGSAQANTSAVKLPQADPAAQAATKAPAFSLPDLDDKQVKLEDVLKEKPALVVFWATWCPHCQDAVPSLIDFQKTQSDKATLLAIDVMESKERVASFVKNKGINYRVLLDTDGEVSNQYGVVGIPTILVIDKSSNIKYSGYDLDEAKKALASLTGVPEA